MATAHRYYLETKRGLMEFSTKKDMVLFVLKWTDQIPSFATVYLDPNRKKEYGNFSTTKTFYGYDAYFYPKGKYSDDNLMVPMPDGSLVRFDSKKHMDYVNRRR